MRQSLSDQVSRLRAMASGDGRTTWDLSENDVEAIETAVKVLSVMESADQRHKWIETSPIAGGINPVSLCIGTEEFDSTTTIGCFVKAYDWVK